MNVIYIVFYPPEIRYKILLKTTNKLSIIKKYDIIHLGDDYGNKKNFKLL